MMIRLAQWLANSVFLFDSSMSRSWFTNDGSRFLRPDPSVQTTSLTLEPRDTRNDKSWCKSIGSSQDFKTPLY